MALRHLLRARYKTSQIQSGFATDSGRIRSPGHRFNQKRIEFGLGNEQIQIGEVFPFIINKKAHGIFTVCCGLLDFYSAVLLEFYSVGRLPRRPFV